MLMVFSLFSPSGYGGTPMYGNPPNTPLNSICLIGNIIFTPGCRGIPEVSPWIGYCSYSMVHQNPPDLLGSWLFVKCVHKQIWLVVSNMFGIFHNIWDVILPIG